MEWRNRNAALLAAAALLVVGLAGLAAQSQQAAEEQRMREPLSKGQRIATAVGIVTSTAVSPLLGVCVLGAYEYFKTPEPDRAKLPKYTSPWVWVPVALLLAVILFKDSIGGMAPLLKKPLDALEVLLVNKAALVLIAFPVVFHQVARIFGMNSIGELFAFTAGGLEPVAYAAEKGLGDTVATAAIATLAVLLVISGMIVAFVVWLLGNVFDVLVLLSPFPFLDLMIKGIRTALFAVIAAATLIEPKAGLVISLVIIVIAFLLAGWTSRITVFGAVFAWDLLRVFVFGARRRPSPGEAVPAFSAMKLGKLPKRAYGTLVRGVDDVVEFRHRAWLTGPIRTVRLEGWAGCDVGRGLFHPSIVQPRPDGGKHRTLFRLLPRYAKSEDQLCAVLGLSQVRDLRWGKGFRNFWSWLTDDAGAAEQASA